MIDLMKVNNTVNNINNNLKKKKTGFLLKSMNKVDKNTINKLSKYNLIQDIKKSNLNANKIAVEFSFYKWHNKFDRLKGSKIV